MTKTTSAAQIEWLVSRTVANVTAQDPNISELAIRAFAGGMLGQLEGKDIRKMGQFDICDAFFNWINTTSPAPNVYAK